MGTLSVAVINPLAGVNQIVNPSLEWPDAGVPRGWASPALAGLLNPATLTRDTEPTSGARAGAWCLEVDTDGTAVTQGAAALLAQLGFNNGQPYAVSFWVHNNNNVLTAYLANATSLALWGSTAIPALNAWQKVSLTATPNADVPAANAAGTAGALLIVRTTAQVAITFYLDAVQVEQGTLATSYMDGDQPDCFWLGAPSFSMSQRSAQSARGGSIVKIFPSASYIDAIKVQGIGMGPVKNIALPRGLLGGATFQHTVKGVRQINLSGEMAAPASNYTLDQLLTKRDALIGLLKPDLLAQPQQTVVRMDTGGRALNIGGRYHSGLEFAGLTGFKMAVPLILQNFDPRWFEDYDASTQLAYSLTLASASRILQKPSAGVWAPIGSGALDGSVQAIAMDANQNIYVGGTFTQMGGVANTSRIAMWNPNTSAWTALTTGCDNSVFAIAIGADGMVYVGGFFTNSGGVATHGIAKWNPTTSTWTALAAAGVPATYQVNCLAFDKSGNLYAGGIFPLMNSVANTLNIAKWDGANWTALGTGVDISCDALLTAPDGVTIYAGGHFFTAGGVTGAAGVAVWNGTVWKALGTGSNIAVTALALAPNGDLYVGGTFANQKSVAGTVNIAKWTGAGWIALGGGITTLTVRAIVIRPDGMVIVGGYFAAVNGALLATTAGLAIWNGSAWASVDVSLGLVGGTATIAALLFNPNSQTLYIGWNTDSGTPPSVATTVVTNPGAGIAATVGSVATAYPKIFFTGPGTLYELVNLTTGDSIYFNAYPLQANETVVLDLTPGHVSFVSNLRGNIYGQIVPGSNISSWRLLPGANTIGVYIGPTVSAATACWMTWRNQYHSIDGLQ